MHIIVCTCTFEAYCIANVMACRVESSQMQPSHQQQNENHCQHAFRLAFMFLYRFSLTYSFHWYFIQTSDSLYSYLFCFHQAKEQKIQNEVTFEWPHTNICFVHSINPFTLLIFVAAVFLITISIFIHLTHICVKRKFSHNNHCLNETLQMIKTVWICHPMEEKKNCFKIH